jgi:hypothetical protein
MDNRQYQVEVVSRQRTIFQVEAADVGAAERIAEERWQRGDSSDVVGFDWQELEGVRVHPAADPSRDIQDDALTLRFIGEREQLLLRLGGRLIGASMNDAISAGQVARDLGWYRQDAGRTNVPDVVRATRALERLCAGKRLVCFSRTRVRAGERGEIRLYCTPEYLERLTVAEGLTTSPGAV